MRFEDRVQIVADQRNGIAAASGWGACILSHASQIADRTGARWRRFEIKRVSPPNAREVRPVAAEISADAGKATVVRISVVKTRAIRIVISAFFSGRREA